LTPDRPRFASSSVPAFLFGVVGFALVVALALPLANAGPTAGGATSAATGATSIVPLGVVPSEIVVGGTTVLAWQALDAHGVRVPYFAAPAELTVAESANGSSAPAWVNATTAGPLVRAANGTFTVPAFSWSAGALRLSLVLAVTGPVTVRLFGPLLPSLPPPMALTVLPDVDHLVLYAPQAQQNELANASRSYSAFWHVHDRFGNPAPGATLMVEFSTGASENTTVVPVVWTTEGATGAWVNFSARGPGGGTLAVVDAAGTPLLGPWAVPAVTTGSPARSASLSPLAAAGVAFLAVGGIGGIGALLYGGRPRPSPTPSGEEEELRRLAEGRVTVVEILRRAGPLSLTEIEARWDPPPAPAALADWVASLVTDGTLTATLGEGGRARFALAERPSAKPRVTLDEEALEAGIARREAAVSHDHDEGEGPADPPTP